jgi:hypothetical protein
MPNHDSLLTAAERVACPSLPCPRRPPQGPPPCPLSSPSEGFDRLAREMKVSRGTVLRAYDFANRDEAAAAAREGRKPTRPPYKWSDESRAAKRKSRGA